MRILVAKEKHSNRYFDVTTNEQLHKVSIKLLSERLKWYHPGEFPTAECVSNEVFERLPEDMKSSVKQRNLHINREIQSFEYNDKFYKDVKNAINSPSELKIFRELPISYWLLERRSDYEYEEVELIEPESVC